MSIRKQLKRTFILTNFLFKLREQTGFWGIVLSAVNIVIQLFVYSSVMSRFIGPDFNLFSLLIAICFWKFFIDATSYAIPSLIQHKVMLVNSNIDPLACVMARVNSGFYIFLIEYILLIILQLIFNFFKDTYLFLFNSTIAIAKLYILTAATSCILAMARKYFHSTQGIWSSFRNILFFLTPVFYPLSILNKNIRSIIEYNPLTLIIYQIRSPAELESLKTQNYILSTFLIGFIILYLLNLRFPNKLKKVIT